MHINSMKEGGEMPDVVVGAHFHKAVLGSYTDGTNFKTYFGMILPSLQMKTRYGQKVSAFQRNDIGVSPFEVSENGLIGFHKPMKLEKW